TAFFELLRLKPSSRLDPTTTRPDCVAFFEDVRRRHASEIRDAARAQSNKTFALAFLPPAGQFQNGNRARGYTIGALEAVALAAAVATNLQLRAWETPDHTFDPHHDDAVRLKTLNYIAVGVLVVTVLVGIVDGVANYGSDTTEEPGTFRF